MLCACQNCDWIGPDSEAEPTHDIWSRVAPGEPMPAGDCPKCGALVQPVADEEADTATASFIAYMLDPATQVMRPVKLDPRDPIRDINAYLCCIFNERVPFDDRHVIYIDDNGMEDGLPAFTMLKGWPNPLAGRLIIVGKDDSGHLAAPTLSMSDVAEKLTVVRPVLDPLFESFTARTESTLIAGTRIGNFGLRLTTSNPEVAA